jgi:hypothetical protein
MRQKEISSGWVPADFCRSWQGKFDGAFALFAFDAIYGLLGSGVFLLSAHRLARFTLSSAKMRRE